MWFGHLFFFCGYRPYVTSRPKRLLRPAHSFDMFSLGVLWCLGANFASFRGVFLFATDETEEYPLVIYHSHGIDGPFIVDFPIKTSIYEGFSMAMLNNQMVSYTAKRECPVCVCRMHLRQAMKSSYGFSYCMGLRTFAHVLRSWDYHAQCHLPHPQVITIFLDGFSSPVMVGLWQPGLPTLGHIPS